MKKKFFYLNYHISALLLRHFCISNFSLSLSLFLPLVYFTLTHHISLPSLMVQSSAPCPSLQYSLQGSFSPLVFFFLFCFGLVFLFLFIYLFIYFWLRWVLVAARGFSLVVVSGGYSSLWCAGFSLRWFPLLQSMDSRHTGSVVAHGFSCSAACGIFPDQAEARLHWQADS